MSTPPFDLNLADMPAAVLAQLLVTRACSDAPLAWAEIGWDAMRYPQHDELAAALCGVVEQLLAAIGDAHGMTSAEVWQRILLDQASGGAS